MKKVIVIINLCIIFLCSHVYAAPELSAGYAALMVMETGEIIFEYNGYEKHSMASTTKIMTALAVLDNSKLDDVVTISPNAARQEGSSAYLGVGEKISVESLLYGLMLNSGNDAATALAEHISASETAFAELMTEYAAKIGANNTAFKNASGLDEEGHYTTAVDLAKITRCALKNDDFKRIVSTVYKEVECSRGKLFFSNHNKLLRSYDGCIGVKTGFTKKTGRCLVSAAERNGYTLICVTLNAPDDWNDHRKLLDYGFDRVVTETVVGEGEILKRIPTDTDGTDVCGVSSREVALPVADYKKRDITLILHTLEYIPESVAKGEKIGEAEVFYKGHKVDCIDILTGNEYIKKKTVFHKLIELCQKLFID